MKEAVEAFLTHLAVEGRVSASTQNQALSAIGLRFLRVGGRGLCLGAGKTRSQKNARKCRRIPHVRRTLC